MSKEGRDSNRVAAILITDENDNVLMGKRNDNDKWANPGGHLKVGEQYYEGAIRELKEETGLDAKKVKLINMTKCGPMLVYLFKITVCPKQEIDTSKDPDKECPDWTYEDPNDIKDELHVPLEDNVVIKYWIEN